MISTVAPGNYLPKQAVSTHHAAGLRRLDRGNKFYGALLSR